MVEGSGDRLHRAEPGERQVQHRRAHLRADAQALVLPPQPGPGPDLPQHREVLGGHVLEAHRAPLGEDGQVERPVARGPVAPAQPVVLDDGPGPFGRGLIGPGHQERHLLRRVQALRGEIGERGQFLGIGQAQFQARSGHPETEKRPVVDQHASLWDGRAATGIPFSRGRARAGGVSSRSPRTSRRRAPRRPPRARTRPGCWSGTSRSPPCRG